MTIQEYDKRKEEEMCRLQKMYETLLPRDEGNRRIVIVASQAIMVNGVIYRCSREAAEATRIGETTIRTAARRPSHAGKYYSKTVSGRGKLLPFTARFVSDYRTSEARNA